MKTSKVVKINKLFGKYDNEIDLSNRAIIFIGENGVGKTTMMKILENLMNKNYTELIKYDFESIDIEVSSKNGRILKETLKYEDLLPSNEKIKNVIKASHSFFSDISDDWDCYVDSYSDEEKIQKYDEEYSSDRELTDEEKIDFWSDFDYSCAFDEADYEYGDFCSLSVEVMKDLINKNEFKNIVRKIIKNEEFDDLYFNNYINEIKYEEKFGYEFEHSKYRNHTVWKFNDVKESLKTIIDIIKNHIDNILKDNTEINVINKNKLTKILNMLIDNIDKPVDILDMTKVYNFGNELLPRSLLTNKLVEWKAIAPYNYRYVDELELNIYNSLLKEWDEEEGFLEDSSKDISDLNNSIIDINSIIKHYFYNIDFVVNTNRKALEYYVAFKNNNIAIPEEIGDLTKIKDTFIKYIRPIILKNSPFDTDWTAFVFQRNGGSQDRYTNVFSNFCEKLSNNYKENIDSKIIVLQELLDKYMMNKDVEVTPMGLIVKSKEDNRNIPLDSLSSGEKKLLVIFMHCLFNEDVPIIIDEPEISLSIIWQENLLPDLLEKTSIKQVIVATHSSAVISASSLDKYIVPLPNSMVGGNPNE